MATPKPLQSVSRAIGIIEYLAAQDHSGVALGTIAKDLNINKATVYNTLATLREHTWVEQDAETGFYALGDGIIPIANYQTSTQQTVDLLRPYLARIGNRFNELVHLGELIDTDVIYLDKVEPDRPVRVVSEVGRRATAVTTSLGRALIGCLDNRDQQLERYLAAPALLAMEQSYQDTIYASVLDNFERLDREGWTEDVEENEPGITCVAVPLITGTGNNIAVSISAPAERMDASYRSEIAKGIRDELAAIPRSDKIRLRPLTSA
ncbi:MAG: IclR family transcriptional regulator [Actinomycetaceae bacterium]|nr:IclR family transcriptional regulator [Actinomycetaceae bacterium]